MSIPKPNARPATNEIMSVFGRWRPIPANRARSSPQRRGLRMSPSFHGVTMLVNRLERTLVDLRYLAADVDDSETQADVVYEKTRSLASGSIFAACTAIQMSLARLAAA